MYFNSEQCDHETNTDPITMEVKRESERETVEPEKEIVEDKQEEQSPVEEDVTLKEMLRVDEQYVPLLTLLEQFSPGEDGIQFNRKLRHFETTVSSLCPGEEHLQQAFATFRAAALQNAETARKLAAVGASFTRQQGLQLRGALLNVVMQGTFSKLDVLERSNPLYLINAANLMGYYFSEARLCNGKKVHILASPLLQYMRALLGSDDIRAHRSLATQLMQNGLELQSILAQEIDELSISIRLRLLSPPPINTIWFLLSADLCLNKFLPLPNTLQQFYAAQLELRTEENFSEVRYGSWKKSPKKHDYNRPDTNEISEKLTQDLSQTSFKNNEDTKPKLQLILGAGASLLKQMQALSVGKDTFEICTAKNYLRKRHDLNSWRQHEEEEKEETECNETVLPPNVKPFPVPDHPPRINWAEESDNSQQDDGTYIQTQCTNVALNEKGGDTSQNFPERTPLPPTKTERLPPVVERVDPIQPEIIPEHINNKLQNNNSRRSIGKCRKEKKYLRQEQSLSVGQVTSETWTAKSYLRKKFDLNSRRQQEEEKKEQIRYNQTVSPPNVQSSPVPDYRRNEKKSVMDYPHKNRQQNWTDQKCKDIISEDEDNEKYKDQSTSRNRDGKPMRINRKSNGEEEGGRTKTPPRRHVSEVPNYWDHDDRCDRDYNNNHHHHLSVYPGCIRGFRVGARGPQRLQ